MDETLDTSGLICPLPVLRARKELKGMSPGDVLTMISTDPVSAIDIPHMCETDGHELMEMIKSGRQITFYIRRK